VKEFQRRYGVNILIEDFDLNSGDVCGENIHSVFEGMAEVIHSKGKLFSWEPHGVTNWFPLGNMNWSGASGLAGES